jgi:hypothetical protein
MIGRMIRAFGADDVVCLGQKFKKRRFQMIADSQTSTQAISRA